GDRPARVAKAGRRRVASALLQLPPGGTAVGSADRRRRHRSRPKLHAGDSAPTRDVLRGLGQHSVGGPGLSTDEPVRRPRSCGQLRPPDRRRSLKNLESADAKESLERAVDAPVEAEAAPAPSPPEVKPVVAVA